MPKPSSDWRTRVLDQLEAPRENARITTALALTPKLNRLIRRAAQKRGMSPSAYIRRAAVAFAVHDLRESWTDQMTDEPGFGAYGVPPGQAPYRPHGHGFGDWLISGLRKAFPDD